MATLLEKLAAKFKSMPGERFTNVSIGDKLYKAKVQGTPETFDDEGLIALAKAHKGELKVNQGKFVTVAGTQATPSVTTPNGTFFAEMLFLAANEKDDEAESEKPEEKPAESETEAHNGNGHRRRKTVEA